jgi:hypothetical protein
LLQRPDGRMGRLTPIAGAETALTREFGKHVFEIAELLRVPHIRYNYRVWVVGATGIEPVTPSMSTRCSKPNRLILFDFLKTLGDVLPGLFTAYRCRALP